MDCVERVLGGTEDGADPLVRGSLKLVIAIGLVIAVAGVWVQVTKSAPVSDQEAREFVGRLVEVAESGDVAGLCQHAVLVGSCEILVEELGERVPSDPPEIVCTWPLTGSGHRVAALSGVDGAGEDYVNYLAVVRDGSRLRGSPTVYWVDHVIEDLDLAFEGDVVCR